MKTKCDGNFNVFLHMDCNACSQCISKCRVAHGTATGNKVMRPRLTALSMIFNSTNFH